MSLAEYVSRPFPVLTKLAILLRTLPLLRFLLAKRASHRARDQQVSGVLHLGQRREVSQATIEPTDAAVAERADLTVADITSAGLPISIAAAVVEPVTDDQSLREALIRRRWAETGSKLWSPVVHGARGAALNIQGRVGLLPVEPGERSPRYDTLEFKAIAGRIVCEGVAVDPPTRRIAAL
jgi:hypothetical protein